MPNCKLQRDFNFVCCADLLFTTLLQAGTDLVVCYIDSIYWGSFLSTEDRIYWGSYWGSTQDNIY